MCECFAYINVPCVCPCPRKPRVSHPLELELRRLRATVPVLVNKSKSSAGAASILKCWAMLQYPRPFGLRCINCMCAHTRMHMWMPTEARGIRSPGAGIYWWLWTTWCGCWESDSGPLEEQVQVFLPLVLFLSPLLCPVKMLFCKKTMY